MPKPSISVALIKMAKLLEVVGIDVIMDKLNEIDGSPDSNKEMENFIVSITCSHYNVKKIDVLTTRHLTEEETIPRDMIIVLIAKNVRDYSGVNIASICKKPPSTVSRVNKSFREMNDKIKHEREFLNTYNDLTTQIEAYKEQQQLD